MSLALLLKAWLRRVIDDGKYIKLRWKN